MKRFCPAVGCGALGFRASPEESSLGAVVVGSKLDHDEVALLDLGFEVRPEESGVETAAAGSAKGAVDDVDLFKIEMQDEWRAPAPLIHVGAVAQRSIAHGRVAN